MHVSIDLPLPWTLGVIERIKRKGTVELPGLLEHPWFHVCTIETSLGPGEFSLRVGLQDNRVQERL